jgi:hypothetical protein
MTIPVKMLAFCAVMSAVSGAQAETYAPRVVGSVDAAGRSAPVTTACGRTHQSGVSDCTHDRRQSRTRNAKIFEAFWGEDGSETDHAAIESGNAQFHDGYRSEMIIVRPATVEEREYLNAKIDATCDAKASVEAPAVKHETKASRYGSNASESASEHNIMRSNGPIEIPRTDRQQTATGHKVISSDGHITDRSVYLALSAHRRNPSQRRNTRCPRW